MARFLHNSGVLHLLNQNSSCDHPRDEQRQQQRISPPVWTEGVVQTSGSAAGTSWAQHVYLRHPQMAIETHPQTVIETS